MSNGKFPSPEIYNDTSGLTLVETRLKTSLHAAESSCVCTWVPAPFMSVFAA